MNIDHIIIGQGISGTLLSRALIKEGKQVVVIDEINAASASRVASGVINPVTGMRLVKTWMIDLLLPFAWATYREIETEFGTSIVDKCNILGFHPTQEAALIFSDKQEIEKEYLERVGYEEKWSSYFRFNYGIGEIEPCLLVNLRALLSAWRNRLIESNSLLEDRFSWEDCKIEEDGITYKNITAQNIIFCDGATCSVNPYFDRLPWSKDKGEALIVDIPDLPANNIYKQGINIVPWHNGLFWVGATHDWKFTDMQPTLKFRQQVEERLNYWLKLPYTIVDHIVAARPVNMDRKPFVGFHPLHPAVGIFNGMGTKGCSVGPWFAHQFARHLAHGEPISTDVDVNRFSRILSR